MEPLIYKLIVTIVGKGKANKVVDAAHQAGATGATILYGHGSAVHLFLGISIDPEKEIVFTIVEEGKTQAVLEVISREMELEHPNKGIAFVLSLDQVAGIHRSVDDEDEDVDVGVDSSADGDDGGDGNKDAQ